MAFAPPKKSFTPGDSSDSPVRGRLARAAVGAAGGASFGDHDGLDADGNAILGSKHLWLVESQDAPRSPGVATVAAVSRSPGRERPRSERVNAAKGPAFAHLLRQSEHLAKRLHAAHGHLAKAFGAGKETTHMSTKLRLQSGAHALKCVAEAIPVGDALLKNWDDAWSSRMHHLVRAKARAESDLDAMRRHAETVLAEAEAAHAETEAYRAEIDANVDRIERAKTYAAERDKLSARLDDALARADAIETRTRRSRRNSRRRARPKKPPARRPRRRRRRRARRAFERRRTRRRWRRRAGNWRSAPRRWRTRRDAPRKTKPPPPPRTLRWRRCGARRRRCARRWCRCARRWCRCGRAWRGSWKGERRRRNWRRTRRRLVDWRRRARRRRRRRRPPRRRRRPPRRPGVGRWKRGVSRRRRTRGANRAECREVREAAAKKQIDLQERVIELEEKLRDARKSLEDARATAAAASDVEPQMRKMEATSRRLRREMAAAERVRFAAKLAADDAESRRAAAATDGDEDALAELNARRDVVGERRDFDAMAELAGRVASMQTEMAAMRSSFTGDVDDASRRREGDENAAAGSADVATEVATLRRRLEEANAHVAVLADSRDRALMESVRYASTAAAIGVAEASGGPFVTPAVRSRGGPGGGLVTPAETPRAGAGAEVNASTIPASLLKARAEADRLLLEAESRGREAFGKMARASAMFEAQAGRITSGVKAR